MSDIPHDVGCIVLAAGGSRRFGSPKQLKEVNGETLVHRAVRAAAEATVSGIVLVTGAESDAVSAAVLDFDSLVTVFNPEWRTGLASSLRTGLAALVENFHPDGALLTLVDQPLVDSRSIQLLLEAFGSTRRIVASSYEGNIGAPAIIGREFFHDLMKLEGDHGAGPWLRRRVNQVTEVAMSAAALDVDVPADVQRLRRASKEE